jgi:serine/threonine protein kinase
VLDGGLASISEPVDLPRIAISPFLGRLRVREDFFEKYQYLAVLDEGGQGRVWKVWDYEFRRELALKALCAEMAASHSACYRFLAEAQITSQLRHPGILPIYDAGLDLEGKPFYTTDLCKGVTLDKHFAKLRQQSWKRLTLNSALETVARVCEIMAHVHSQGVIHRDLKPGNILVGEFGDVRVVDWGSASLLRKASKNLEQPFLQMTTGGIQTDREQVMSEHPEIATEVQGWPTTPIYTAPELLEGQTDQAGTETDVYSMGVILYELLAGQLPFIVKDRGISRAEVHKRVIEGKPIPLRRLNPSRSRDLAVITERAMARDRLSRYRTMQDLASDIHAALQLRPVQARNPGTLLKARRFVQRHSIQATAVGLVLLVLAISFAVIKGLQADQRVARQIQAWEGAQLARRSGQWREALKSLNEAEAAGYGDLVTLELKRAEAWRALDRPDRSMAELVRMGEPTDDNKGEVLLAKGEIELCDEQKKDEGAQLVAKALEAGLGPGDKAFAKGLLAPTTPEALRCFQQALEFDPYQYTAHVHLLGLEFLLGLHGPLKNESEICKTLFPDDPSAVYVQAFECALDGNLPGAESFLAGVRSQISGDVFRQLESGCRLTAALSASLDVDKVVDFVRTNQDQALLEMTPIPQSGAVQGPAEFVYPVRMPQLPCLTQGLVAGFTAVRSLNLGLLAEPTAAVQKIKAAHDVYPEALAPLLGGLELDQAIRRTRIESRAIRTMEADLFELAANSGSMFPKVPSLARYLAARTQFLLAIDSPAQTNAARQACVSNIEKACATGGGSAKVLGDYFDFAFRLEENDLARIILLDWERLAPEEPQVKHGRIDLDIKVGALEEAHEELKQMLALNPADSWAQNRQMAVLQRLKEMSTQSQ